MDSVHRHLIVKTKNPRYPFVIWTAIDLFINNINIEMFVSTYYFWKKLNLLLVFF